MDDEECLNCHEEPVGETPTPEQSMGDLLFPYGVTNTPHNLRMTVDHGIGDPIADPIAGASAGSPIIPSKDFNPHDLISYHTHEGNIDSGQFLLHIHN